MNGFGDHGLDEASFGEKSSLGAGISSFDAFPKTKSTYTTRSARGGQLTALLICTCILLSFTELKRWWRGQESHHFSVEKGVGHELQINLDIVMAMRCDDLHINVQDASGDRILAADRLKRDTTKWSQWVDLKGVHKLEQDSQGRVQTGAGYEEDHVHDVIAQAQKRRKFAKTPRIKGIPDSCRVFGSLDLNKVQGDFHITARGHGYMATGDHLSHDAFNFSHIVNEFSFGPFYPSLVNPLDKTIATTPEHFYKFQYYLSVVPTIYTTGPNSNISTNQYAVTQQSRSVNEMSIPGVFVKFDIEPILLTVSEARGGFFALVVRIVNLISGVLVAGGWCYQIGDWAIEVIGRRRRKQSEGMLHGRSEKEDD